MRRFLIALVVLAPFAFSSIPAIADNEGQADLDMATDLQITAETLGDLEKVIKLAESALDKGLEKGQQEFAKKLLAATLYQHAKRASDLIFERERLPGNWTLIRLRTLKDVAKAKSYDA